MLSVDALQLARHLPGKRKNRRVVATCLIEAGDEMSAAGPCTPATDAEPAGEFRLAGGRERSAFLVADADPLDLAVAHSVADRIERIGNQPGYVRDADLFERVNQGVGHRL
jgi:hypothetical protein